MSTKAIVGVTLCVLGLLLCLTVYGVVIAPLFLVPGIVLCHLGLRTFRNEKHRTSAALVVTLTLSYIASVCATTAIIIGAVFLAKQSERPTYYDPRNDPEFAGIVGDPVKVDSAKSPAYDLFAEPFVHNTAYVLAVAYGAKSSPVNEADCAILLRFGTNGTLWNRSSAPLIRDYFDPKITAEQWVENSRKPLGELAAVLLRFQVDCQLLTDTGAKETLKPIVEIQESMLKLYRQLQGAIAVGNASEQNVIIEQLKAAGLRKQQIALPIAQRLRSQIGAGVADKRLDGMLNEIGDLLTPK